MQNTYVPKKRDPVGYGVEWMVEARCVAYPTRWWTETDTGARKMPLWSTEENHRAKEVCYECPVRMQCLEYALAHEDHGAVVPWAIYGGKTPIDRLMLTGHLVFAEQMVT